MLKYLELQKLAAIDPNIFNDKTIFLRVDTNSTVVDGEIKPNERILAAARAIRRLTGEYKARVIVGTHNGREGDVSFVGLGFGLKTLRQSIVGKIKYIGNTFADDHLNDEAIKEIKKLKSGEAILLENLRFLPGEELSLTPEEHSTSEFIRDLVDRCNVEYFVLDAFSVAHRAHRSVVGFKDIPNIAGPDLHRELSAINDLKTRFLNGESPSSIFILGGKKIQDYFALIERALKDSLVRRILTGGLLANLCLFAAGYDLGEETKRVLLRRDKKGKSVWDYLQRVKDLLRDYPNVFVLPIDVAGGDGSSRIVHEVNRVPNDFCVYDIGNETVAMYEDMIDEVVRSSPGHKQVMVYIKGPVGASDLSINYNFGSSQLFHTVLDPRYKTKLYTVVGGGDTTAMLREFAIPESRIDYISLAGGALIKMLAGEVLPGVRALEESYVRFHQTLGIESD